MRLAPTLCKRLVGTSTHLCILESFNQTGHAFNPWQDLIFGNKTKHLLSTVTRKFHLVKGWRVIGAQNAKTRGHSGHVYRCYVCF